MYLKACPFCGGKAVLEMSPPEMGCESACVYCVRCGAAVTSKKGRKAAAKWNRRAGPRPRGERV